MTSNRNRNRPRSKVARVIEEYDLIEIGDELERRWVATDENGMSLRELAEFFNRAVLEAAIEESDLNVLDVDVTQIYEQLTDDQVSTGDKTRVRRRLERNGCDVESVLDDFVTHQTIHTYLREYRDVEQHEPTSDQRLESTIERIEKLQNRSASVTRDAVEGLQRADIVPDGDVDVIVDIQVVYTESGDHFNVFELLDRDVDDT